MHYNHQEDIQDTDKLHTRTLKRRTKQSSPLQGEIEGVGNIKDTKLYIMDPSPVSPKERALKKSPFLRTKTEKCYDL